VSFVPPRSSVRGHCHLCVEDEVYHDRAEVKEKEALLSDHYKDYVEPIKLPRPFEAEEERDEDQEH